MDFQQPTKVGPTSLIEKFGGSLPEGQEVLLVTGRGVLVTAEVTRPEGNPYVGTVKETAALTARPSGSGPTPGDVVTFRFDHVHGAPSTPTKTDQSHA
jgi:hypothetical protein